jgi:hypothetical protein
MAGFTKNLMIYDVDKNWPATVPNCLIMNPKFRPNWRWCWCFPYMNHDSGNLSWGCYKLKDVEACARVLGKSNPCLKHTKRPETDEASYFLWFFMIWDMNEIHDIFHDIQRYCPCPPSSPAQAGIPMICLRSLPARAGGYPGKLT